MDMLLYGIALSLIGVTVSAVLFLAATRDAPSPKPAARVSAPALGAPMFFADPALAMGSAPATKLLLLEIDRHVRLEQAAAEAFLMAPSRDSLHSHSRSPLVH